MILLLALHGCLWIPAPPEKAGTVDTSTDEADTGADTDGDSGPSESTDDTTADTDTSSGDTDTGDTDTSGGQEDADGDGFAADADCDDADAAIHPGASEVCDDADNDCDGDTDEDATDAYSWTVDEDGDGYGGTSVTACDRPANVAAAGDCYDDNADAYPGQAAYFDADRGDGCYDYDCDSAETAEHGESYYSCYLNGGGPYYVYVAGWDGTIPACGGIGAFVDGEFGAWNYASVCPTPASTKAACR